MAEQQQSQQPLKDPWMIAIWPGMGNVALIAGGYLIQQLGAKLVGGFPSRDLFEVQSVEVENGVASAASLPRCMIFEWHDPNQRHDLIIFIGEAQPPSGGYAFCHKLIEYAAERGVKRCFTFASMATQLHPTAEPRTFGAATENSLLSELREHEIEVMQDGEISGLNGVLLAAAAEHDMIGACLLGELPYFAVNVPNPGASKAVLEAFATLARIEIDFAEINQQAEAAEKFLLQLLERLQEATGEQLGGEEGFTVPDFAVQGREADNEEESEPEEETLNHAARQRIENLFDKARQDRSKAFDLKQELDRLGVFKQYEDRFLDLFKKAE